MPLFASLLRDPRRWWTFTVVTLLVGALWTSASREVAAGDVARMPSPHAGFPAPDFALEDLSGETVSLADYRGQVVIVNLWASWCGPCRAEMPALQSVYESLSAEGLVVLAVNSTAQDTEEAARAFVTEHALTFPVLLDRADSVSQAYRLRSLPSTFIVDRQGVIDSVLIGGPLAEAVLRSKVADLLAEAP